MSEQLDVLFKDGLVVNAEGITRADVGILGEKIVEVAPDIDPARAQRVIDATGKYVIPGVIDPHSHPVYVDNLRDTSITAAFGGVTSIIHFAYAKPGMKVLPTIDQFRKEGEEGSLLDFGLHIGLFDVKNQLEEVPAAFDKGVTSFKVFMTYAKLQWMTDDYWMAALMDVLAKKHGLIMVHTENGLVTDYLEDKYNREGADPVKTFTAVRPAILEGEAVNRALALAQVMDCAIYIVHNSAAAGLEPIARAKAKGWKVIGETCPHFLTLTEETTWKYKALAKVGPPLRTAADNAALWQGLVDDTLQTVGSDHAAKLKSIDDDFFKAPYGAPQMETMLPMIYHEGVNGGKITLPRLVEVMSTNVAKVFGLYPKKGAIQPGSDADIVLYDPNCRWTISVSNQHSNVNYTLFEGKEVLGKPVLTMSRGQVIVENDTLVAKPGIGKFLSTDTSQIYKKGN